MTQPSMNPAHTLSHSCLDAVNSLGPAAGPLLKGAELRQSQRIFNIHYEPSSLRTPTDEQRLLPPFRFPDRCVVLV